MSGNELMLALSNEVERNERYASPPKLTRAGQVDRRHESEHALAIRDIERGAREDVAAAAAAAAADIADIEGRARVVSDIKYMVDRAAKESALLAQGDPVKEMKYSILDDELFAYSRARANRPSSKGPRIFG